MSFRDHLQMKRRLIVRAGLTFQSGWRVGSGREGLTGSDLGVLRDPQGRPVLPGTSLKGRLRSTCESLAHAMGLSACCLNVQASGVDCVSDTDYFRKVSAKYQGLTGFAQRMDWLDKNICDVCRLFGSPLAAGRLRVSEGKIDDGYWRVDVRDSVVLDRDSHTAVDGLKYDYEVGQPGTRFAVELEVRDGSDAELALLGAALIDWSEGVSLGGFTTRGLGRAAFQVEEVLHVDLEDAKQRLAWLTQCDPDKKYQSETDWRAYFVAFIEGQLAAVDRQE